MTFTATQKGKGIILLILSHNIKYALLVVLKRVNVNKGIIFEGQQS